MLSVKNRTKLMRITSIAAKIIGLPTPNLTELNNQATTRIANSIAQDITHPLHEYLTPLPSGRRYRTLRCRRALLSRSLMPSVIAALNNKPRWVLCSVVFCIVMVCGLYSDVYYCEYCVLLRLMCEVMSGSSLSVWCKEPMCMATWQQISLWDNKV